MPPFPQQQASYGKQSAFLKRKQPTATSATKKASALPAVSARDAHEDGPKLGNPRKRLAAVGPAAAKQRRKKKKDTREKEELPTSEDEADDDDSLSKSDSSSGPVDNDSAEGDDEEVFDDEEIVNIEFEFFDPRDSDIPTLKRLLAALFDADAEMFNLSQLADLIVKQPLLGSTVKVNGIESDPFAMLTVLNMNQHRDAEVMDQIKKYLLGKVMAKDKAFHARLFELLQNTCGERNVGLLLAERLVNMPAQIAPPMFRMLVKEIQWAIDEKERYNFSHYLLMSKIYRTVASDLVEVPEEDGEGRIVVQRKEKSKRNDRCVEDVSEFGKDLFYYAAEHEVVKQFAEHSCTFSLTHSARKTVADARRAFHEFGIIPALEVFLIPAAKLEAMIEAMEEIVSE